MTGPGRPVRHPANTRASVLLTWLLRLAAFPCMPETRDSIVNLPGSFQLLRHGPVGGSSGRSVVHTPRHWETERPRAAQFAPWAVYIPAEARRGAEGRSAGW